MLAPSRAPRPKHVLHGPRPAHEMTRPPSASATGAPGAHVPLPLHLPTANLSVALNASGPREYTAVGHRVLVFGDGNAHIQGSLQESFDCSREEGADVSECPCLQPIGLSRLLVDAHMSRIEPSKRLHASLTHTTIHRRSSECQFRLLSRSSYGCDLASGHWVHCAGHPPDAA